RPHQLGGEPVGCDLGQRAAVAVAERLVVGRGMASRRLAAELDPRLMAECQEASLQLRVPQAPILLGEGLDLLQDAIGFDFHVRRQWVRDGLNIPAATSAGPGLMVRPAGRGAPAATFASLPDSV